MGGGAAPISSMSQGGVPGGGVVKLKRQIPSVECKFFDSTANCTTATNTWTQVDLGAILSGIVQGTGPSERVGRKIKVVGLVIRLAFTTSASTLWCVDVVRDKQCNGAAATAAQIYTVATDFSTLPNPFEETRFAFVKRFQQQNFVNLEQIAGATAQQMVSKALKLNFQAEYNASTGAVTDLTSDNLQIFMCVCAPDTSANIPNVKSFCRVLYTDA